MLRFRPFCSQSPVRFRSVTKASCYSLSTTANNEPKTLYQDKPLPSTAEVVIMGGGVVGCSTAYHLAKLGVNAVVVEKGLVSCGTSWHAAGLVGQLRGSKTETLMSGVYGSQLFEELSRDGFETGFRRTGSISVARTPERLNEIKRRAALAHGWGLEARFINPEEAKQFIPMLYTDDLLGILYLPGDGTITSSDAVQAYVQAGKHFGAQVIEQCEIQNVEDEDGGCGGYRITTSKGTIETPVVVNCAGLWSRKLGKYSGVNIPLHACEHFYVVSKPLDDNHTDPYMPVLRDPDAHLYFREWSGGILAGSFELTPKPVWDDNPPNNFEFQLFDDDWDHFAPYMDEIMTRLPALQNAEIQMVNGPESFTPDNQYILGESPEKRRYYVAAGMNSSGIASSGGMGNALSKWIVHDRVPYDLWKLDIRRFQHIHQSQALVRDGARESLGLHYEIGFPKREFSMVRNVRKSALYEKLKQQNACFGSKAGWERALFFGNAGGERPTLDYTFLKPAFYPNVQKEHLAIRNNVGLLDVSSFGKILVVGADATSELQRFCCNNIAKPVGSITYTQMLNVTGGIEADITVHRIKENEYILITATSNAPRDIDWLTRHCTPGSQFFVQDITSGTGVIAVMGPKSEELLAKITHHNQRLDIESFPFGTFQEIDLGYVRGRACRITYVGEMGWELHVSTDCMAHVYETLLSAAGENGVQNCGYYSIDGLRIESGYRAIGHELTVDESPYEAGLGFCVDVSKDFIGKAAVLERKQQPKKRLVQVKLHNPEVIVHGGEHIKFDGEYVGYLESAAMGWTVGSHVGMGYVNLKPAKVTKKKLQDTMKWSLEVAGDSHDITVQFEPLVSPKEKIQGRYDSLLI